jgi:hypothetical protein
LLLASSLRNCRQEVENINVMIRTMWAICRALCRLCSSVAVRLHPRDVPDCAPATQVHGGRFPSAPRLNERRAALEQLTAAVSPRYSWPHCVFKYKLLWFSETIS